MTANISCLRPQARPESSKVRVLPFILLLTIATLAGCGKSDAKPAKPAKADDPQSQLTLDPAQTFAQSCARCHGPQGQFYALPFKYQGNALREKIRAMMTGNAQLNPTEADIDAMLQYHLQIREHLQNK